MFGMALLHLSGPYCLRMQLVLGFPPLQMGQSLLSSFLNDSLFVSFLGLISQPESLISRREFHWGEYSLQVLAQSLAFLIWAVQHKSCYHLRSFRHLWAQWNPQKLNQHSKFRVTGRKSQQLLQRLQYTGMQQDKQSLFFTVTTWPSTAYFTL